MKFKNKKLINFLLENGWSEERKVDISDLKDEFYKKFNINMNSILVDFLENFRGLSFKCEYETINIQPVVDIDSCGILLSETLIKLNSENDNENYYIDNDASIYILGFGSICFQFGRSIEECIMTLLHIEYDSCHIIYVLEKSYTQNIRDRYFRLFDVASNWEEVEYQLLRKDDFIYIMCDYEAVRIENDHQKIVDAMIEDGYIVYNFEDIKDKWCNISILVNGENVRICNI